MHPYVFVPLTACIVAATLALTSFGRSQGTGFGRPVGFLYLGIAFWAFCEALWNLAPDAETGPCSACRPRAGSCSVPCGGTRVEVHLPLDDDRREVAAS